MYAVIEIKGKQYRVEEGDRFIIPRYKAEDGDEVKPDRVLLVGGKKLRIGTPDVKGAAVKLVVVGQQRGPKIRGFKYRPKSGWKRSWGHRDEQTVVKVEKIKA